MGKKNKNEEKMQITSFSLPVEERRKYEELFKKMGLVQWANGVRFALAEFYKAHADEYIEGGMDGDKSNT